MKNKILPCLAVICSICMTSCSEESTRFSVFIYSKTDTFINSIKDKIIQKIGSEYDMPLVRFAESSQIIQNEQIVEVLDKKMTNFLLVNVVDRLASSSIIEKAKISNVPVIFFNREPLVKDLIYSENAYYVGTSPESEGRLQGEFVNSIFNSPEEFAKSKFDRNGDGELGIVLLKGSLNHQDSELRCEESIGVLTRYGYKIKILSAPFCNWDREVASKSFEQLYKEYDKSIDLLISANDDMALGAIDYLKKTENYDFREEIIDQFFPVVGIDATETGTQSVDRGELTGTVINDSQAQAEAILDLVHCILEPDKYKWEDFPHTFDNEKFIHLKPKLYERKNL